MIPKDNLHKKIYCNTCKATTRHELKGTHERLECDEQTFSWGVESVNCFSFEYKFWVCLGCDTALLEEFFQYHDEDIQEYKYYPNRLTKQRNFKHYRHLESKMFCAYKEVITAFNQGLYLSSAIGLRILLEMICVGHGITKPWRLNDKLKELEKIKPGKYITIFYSFKFMGDDAAHKFVAPKRVELSAAIDVLEDLLDILYELEHSVTEKAQKLSKTRPSDSTRIEKAKSKKESTN